MTIEIDERNGPVQLQFDECLDRVAAAQEVVVGQDVPARYQAIGDGDTASRAQDHALYSAGELRPCPDAAGDVQRPPRDVPATRRRVEHAERFTQARSQVGRSMAGRLRRSGCGR